MTRFVMTADEAVRLVIDSANLIRGGEVFITKMPVLRIEDLARAMIDLLAGQFGYQPQDIEIKVIGSKPGEKLYEELMSDEETRRAVELEQYFSVLPAFRGIHKNIQYDYENILNQNVDEPYISSELELMNIENIKTFLLDNKLLSIQENQFGARYWPGDKEEKQL